MLQRTINGDYPIDFVIPWVDGNDPKWRERKAKCVGNIEMDGNQEERYRDWGLLPYWFRGVEKYTPWVRKIWFICDQEPPAWLNKNHPKLNIVRHEDYLPEEYRPAFSSHPIELNLHRIKGLSEHFVYFNDDTFIIRPTKPSYFFKYGFPRDSALINTIPTDDLAKNPEGKIFTIILNNVSYINRDYDFRKCLKKNIGKWLHPCYGKDFIRNMMLCIWPRLVGTVDFHLPQAFLKCSFEKAWDRDFDILDRTSRHHVRNDMDVNQWFIRLRQIMEGQFIVRKPARSAVFTIGQDMEEMLKTIDSQKKHVICLNDSSYKESERAYNNSKEILRQEFDKILPNKSQYEL